MGGIKTQDKMQAEVKGPLWGNRVKTGLSRLSAAHMLIREARVGVSLFHGRIGLLQ